MFDLAEFIKENLISGYENSSFTKEQVSIFAVNYLLKGQITQGDFDVINGVLNPEPEL